MRVFYLFKINDEFTSLTKDNPYSLYKTFNEIYNFNKRDLYLAFDIISQIIKPFNKKITNIDFFNKYRTDINYTKFNNIHIINNYYDDECSKLIINKSHLVIESNVDVPVFLKGIRSKNIFVCDFQNKDYFWLENII